MGKFGDCETETTRRVLVLKENRSQMIFRNPRGRRLLHVQVDGCLPMEGVKCDFLVISHTEVEHFVELKGADVSHAAKQISVTIAQISADPQSLEKHCFIVSSRCPLLTPEIQNLKKSFKRRFNASVKIKNLVCEHVIP